MANYYLGSDVSKGYSDFIILDEQKNISEKHFILDDTARGHQQLYQVLQAFCTKHPSATIFAAVESTGGYENNWYQSFRSFSITLPIKTARLNPIGIHHHWKATLRRTGTDKISATTIAEYQINFGHAIQYDQSDEFKSMKRLYATHRMFVKVRTQLLNQMETVLYTANPELMQYRKHKIPQWLLRVLADYPVADDLAAASIEELAGIPFVSMQRAEAMITAAKNSIASATDSPTQIVMKTIVNQIIQVNRSIQHLEKQADEFANISEIKLLATIKPIGIMSAVGLYVEMDGCIAKFSNAKKLAAFWGVHPRIKESGDGSLVSKMSKQGRKMPRHILFMVALNAIQHNEQIKKIYQRELAKGKCKMAAIGVCMHKLVRIIYGVLSNHTPYNPEIDKQNQMRSKKKKGKTDKSDARRFQPQDQQAPISRKQSKKRKEQEESQSDSITVHEIKILTPLDS